MSAIRKVLRKKRWKDIMELKTKKCSKCQVVKSLNEFGKRGGKKRGQELKPSCKLCETKEKEKNI